MSNSSNLTADKHFSNFPEEFRENVVQVCGSRGEAWLRDLPGIVTALEARWKINVAAHFPGLSYNFVAPATRRDGTTVVLKIGLPVDDGEIHGEIAYLRHSDGQGVVKLIDVEPEYDAFLLERALPGNDLKHAFPEEPDRAVKAAVATLKKLARKPPVNGEFVALETWSAKLKDSKNFSFQHEYAAKALDIFAETDPKRDQLLHGDFHHMNILSNGPDSFLVIDPKGIIGDLKYDIAVFLNNHRAWLKARPDVLEHLNDAVEKFSAAFEIPPNEIKKWAFAQKVLGAFWTATEGGHRWREQLASADLWNV